MQIRRKEAGLEERGSMGPKKQHGSKEAKWEQRSSMGAKMLYDRKDAAWEQRSNIRAKKAAWSMEQGAGSARESKERRVGGIWYLRAQPSADAGGIGRKRARVHLRSEGRQGMTSSFQI